MRKLMRELALPIAILITASELNCVSTSVSLASSYNEEKEGIPSITEIEKLEQDLSTLRVFLMYSMLKQEFR